MTESEWKEINGDRVLVSGQRYDKLFDLFVAGKELSHNGAEYTPLLYFDTTKIGPLWDDYMVGFTKKPTPRPEPTPHLIIMSQGVDYTWRDYLWFLIPIVIFGAICIMMATRCG